MAVENNAAIPVIQEDQPEVQAGRSDSWTRFGGPQAGRDVPAAGEDRPAYLTWEDLWVTKSDGNGKSTAILSGLTGLAQPGEVLAIMGPSGCGKSTLLDVLAGRLGSQMRQSGLILVNGRKQTLAYGTSAYVTQDDQLMATLTVREAVCYSAELLLPDSMSRSQKRERAETAMAEMGLQDAMDTRIGGRSSKGISGGQRRRLSICVETLTRPKLLFLDEPTSGLDGAASYHVMSRIASQARRHAGTVVAAIHQPSSEVFHLFDNLCLLSSGMTVYFGPISFTAEFFAASGFPCPPMRNLADHLLRTINKDFDKIGEVDSYQLGSKSTAEAINILVKSYRSSNISEQVLGQVAQIGSLDGATSVKKGSQARFSTQCLVLTRRSFVNMYRDPGYYWLRLVIYIALCVSIGTIFYDIGDDYSSIQARGSMLLFVSAFLTFMSIGGFPSFVEDLKIYRRERLNGHYGAGAFTIANAVSSSPFLLLISIFPAAAAYYLVGLQKDPQRFFFFSAVLYSSMVLVEGLMMIVASLVPDFLMGIITGAGVQGGMILASGFFRLPNDMPRPVWRYPAYYIAFHRYANQAYYKNEFFGLSFPSSSRVGGSGSGRASIRVSGREIVRDYWQMEVGYSKFVDLAVMAGMAVAYRFLFWVILKAAELKPALLISKLMPFGNKKHHQQVMQMLE
ncbi:ABC transporter G family member 11 [Apostasia shenzhenica]|uniref:ABC transporter G family member 11 n=1 Tax=Apostasia shenzhenica TaxID=1088818 RepID=A0A2I0BDM5_9ASPA|nr:ABC transporter G family member 11 [Apostasia shenzhenica]